MALMISVMKVFIQFLKIPVLICVGFLLFYFLLVSFWILFYRVKGYKLPQNDGIRPKEKNILFKIFFIVPRQFALDCYSKPKNFFKPQGLIIYEGLQGSGKTSTMVRDIYNLQLEYPNAKVITNFAYTQENDSLRDWRQLIYYKNGVEGVIVGMDELQNWFSSKNSANFPPEMLGVVTQNRKNRRVIMGTAQQFYMLAKDIRTQCTEVRHCTTLLGCFTIIHRKRPVLDSEGNVVEWKNKGFYCWVHNEKLRSLYDTYKVIENISQKGFKESKTSHEVKVYNKISKKG